MNSTSLPGNSMELKTLSDICPCGQCRCSVYKLDGNGLWWFYCDNCYWWYIGNM